jgi:50S ribosomal subunit-associated GTPase HflX
MVLQFGVLGFSKEETGNKFLNVAVHTLTSSTNMTDVLASFEAREKYRHFRILVIGRANAGKTTLLKRVCNTTDEPCIYDEESNSLVCFLRSCSQISTLITQR